MQRIAIVALMLVTVSLSGCFFGDDEGSPDTDGIVGGGDGNTDIDLGNGTVNVTASAGVEVSLATVPEGISAGENVTFSWNLVTNDTNGTELETGLVWSVTEIANDSLPDGFEDRVIVSENATAPGTFEASVVFETTGEYFVRAYALLDGNVSWSDPVNVSVEASLKITTVKISNGAVAYSASYSPRDVKIKVGEAVAWENGDDEAHQMVSVDGSTFDTGSIAAGTTSEPIVFETAGSFDYECKLHDGFGVSHTGTVVVEA